jgi:hypothetical protein
MAENFDDLLPSAKDYMSKIATVRAEEAAKAMRKHAEVEAERKALIDQMTKPSGVSDEQRIKRAVGMIQSAVNNGLTEVLVYRFPNTLCTDKGRAINQQETGWEETLTGLPREIYLTWDKHFKPRGYRLRVQIVDFSGGVPGDVGMTLVWGSSD